MAHGHRYFRNDPSQVVEVDAHEELLAALNAIITKCPPDQTPRRGWHCVGLYAGPTSAAYLFYRLSQIYPSLQLEGKSLHAWCLAYLEISPSVKSPPSKVDSSHCGIAQETLVHAAVTAVARKDESYAVKVCEAVHGLLDEDGSKEWLFGLAGYLYLLRLLRTELPKESELQELISKTIEQVADYVLRSQPPWKWHGSQFLGAAHGTIGIITQVALSVPSRAHELQPMLDDLLDLQFDSGNFPSSLPVGTDRLVQFCHGAPGFIISLQNIAAHYPASKAKIELAIDKGVECIWERGLLTKEPSLCHGISGNALVFEDLDRLRRFISFSAQEQLERRWGVPSGADPESMCSLFTGGAGRAWSWAVVDKDLPRTCIGYNDI
ncbi:MAG: hypothetical protein M4579_004659 [Chaenotheca gracillima]|nr:MAG: hypothetical protein M4579_004659 [Chaenotheca gracillima]